MSPAHRPARRPGAAHLERMLCATLVVVLLLVLAAPARAAAQGENSSGDCFAARAQRSSGTENWFGDDIELIYVFVSAEAAGDPVDELAEVLEDRYEVDFVDNVLDVNLEPNERLIVIDDALGVEGEATVFRGERTPSLYLHSTTAAADAHTAMDSACAGSIGSISSQDGRPETDVVDPGEPDGEVESIPEPVAEPIVEVVAGATGSSGVAATWELSVGEPEVLTGYADDAAFDVHLPAGWEVVDVATLETAVVASEIGRDDLSLRVDVDGRPVHTWSPGDRSNIAVAIEPDVFADAGFEIRAFTTTPLVSDLSCPDAGHVGRWVDIGMPTLRGAVRPNELDVARAIASLGPISQLTNEPITFLIDPAGNPALLEAAGSVAAAIGHHGAPIGWNVVSDIDPSEIAGNGSIVAVQERIGEPARVSVTVDGTRAILRLTGDGDDLTQLASSMAHPDRLVYFHGAEIAGDAIPAAAAPLSQEVFGFADAGYDDRTLRGSGEKSLVYRLHIPAGVPPDRATLALYGTYAPVLAERGATVSVRINGSEEEIVAVADDTGRLEVLHTLTAASLRPGLNFVKVTVDLGDAGSIECSSGPRGWLTVSEASGLAVEAADNPEPPELGVEDARFALASTVDFTAADVVIGNGDSLEDIRQALVVIAALADRADGGAPRLVSDEDASTDRHLVVIGPVADRELLADVVPVELGDSVGLVAALPSPYARGRVLLAMTGGTEASTTLAVDAALSARVNDLTASHALIGVDRVQPVGGDELFAERPEQLAFEEREPGPPVDDYEAWLLAQAARIESAAAPQAEVRRLVAFGLLLSAAVLFGFGWIRRIRQSNTAGSGAGH